MKFLSKSCTWPQVRLSTENEILELDGAYFDPFFSREARKIFWTPFLHLKIGFYRELSTGLENEPWNWCTWAQLQISASKHRK